MSKRHLIVVGDTTDHGGSVIEGAPISSINGVATATVGCKVICPAHGDTVIVSGNGFFTIDGKATAAEGDKTSCGATLISNKQSFVSFASNTGGSTRLAHTIAPTLAAAAASPGKALPFFDERLQFVFDQGAPLANIRYQLLLSDGSTAQGTTDDQGRTLRVRTQQPQAIIEAEFYRNTQAAPQLCCAKAVEGGDYDVPASQKVTIEGRATNGDHLGSSIQTVRIPPGESRSLTPGEIAMARTVFKDAVDYAKVKVFNAEYLWFGMQDDQTAVTPDGNMYFPKSLYFEDYAAPDKYESQDFFMHLFIHEMTHVWQFQMGFPVKTIGIALQSAHRTHLFGDLYAYALVRTHHIDSTSFNGKSSTWSQVTDASTLNMEQQADLIADYFCLINNIPYASNSGKKILDRSLIHDALKHFIKNPSNKYALPSSNPF